MVDGSGRFIKVSAPILYTCTNFSARQSTADFRVCSIAGKFYHSIRVML